MLKHWPRLTGNAGIDSSRERLAWALGDELNSKESILGEVSREDLE